MDGDALDGEWPFVRIPIFCHQYLILLSVDHPVHSISREFSFLSLFLSRCFSSGANSAPERPDTPMSAIKDGVGLNPFLADDRRAPPQGIGV
jgi:hypothetical protein